MLHFSQNSKVLLDIYDENGAKIEKVVAADPEQGFYIQYCDLKEDGTLNTMKTQRVYIKFRLFSHNMGIEVVR